MSNFSALIATIQANIKTNGNEEITGAVLQDVLEAMVQALGTEAINNLETALGDEETARQNADGTLQDNIDAEALRAGTAEAGLAGDIAAEELRAKAAEQANAGDIATINGKIPSAATAENKLADKAYVTTLTTALQTAINTINANIDNGYVYAGIATPSGTPVSGKVFYLAKEAGTYTNFGGLVVVQGVNILKYNGTAWSQEQLIGIDDVPTAGSDNLVKSGGIQTQIQEFGYFNYSFNIPNGAYTDLTPVIPVKFSVLKWKVNTSTAVGLDTFVIYYTFEDGTHSISSLQTYPDETLDETSFGKKIVSFSVIASYTATSTPRHLDLEIWTNEIEEVGRNHDAIQSINSEISKMSEVLDLCSGYYDFSFDVPNGNYQDVTDWIPVKYSSLKWEADTETMVGQGWFIAYKFADDTRMTSDLQTYPDANLDETTFGKEVVSFYIGAAYVSGDSSPRHLDIKVWANNIDAGLGKKADKVKNATNGHIATLDANGNLLDSGHDFSDITPSLTPSQMNAVNSGITASKVSEYDAMTRVNDSNFKGIYATSASLPTVSDAAWALVGSQLSQLKLYVWNDSTSGWMLFSNTTYDFTDFSNISSEVGVFVDDYESFNVGDKWTGAIRKAVEVAGVGGTIRFGSGKVYEIDDSIDLLKDQTVIGNNATLKRANEIVVTTTASTSNTITVTSVPNGWKVGDKITVYSGQTKDDVIKETKIGAISGNVVTIVGSFSTSVPNGSSVSKHYVMMDSDQYPVPGCNKVYNLVFDGNKANNDSNYYWERNGALSVFGHGSVISGCKFYDMPVENIVCQGTLVIGNYAQDLNGSFVHLSAAPNSIIEVEEYKGTFITNNMVKRSNALTPNTTGHSTAVVEQSWNPGRLIVIGNHFTGSGNAYCYALVGGGDADETGSSYRKEVVIANNYFRNYETMVGNLGAGQVEVEECYLFNNVFVDCGDSADLNIWFAGKQSGKFIGNQYVNTLGKNLLYSPQYVVNSDYTATPTKSYLQTNYGKLPYGSFVFFSSIDKEYQLLGDNVWCSVTHDLLT